MEALWQNPWSALIVCVTAVVLGVLLWQILKTLSDRDTVDVEVAGIKIRLKREAANEILKEFFREMRVLIDKVPLEQRQKILREVEKADGEVEVGKIYEGFLRKKYNEETKKMEPSKELAYLRDLREAQFIRPKKGGQFFKESLLELKPFGKLMLKYQRDYVLGE